MIKAILTFIFLLPLLTHANDSTPLNLRYEPIQPLISPDNLDPKKITLGAELFNDLRLSHDNTLACASCHNLNTNGADNYALAPVFNKSSLDANTLTVFNSSLNHQQFWDGRALTLQQQIDFVVHNKKEFNSDWQQIISKLMQDKALVNNFNDVYKDGITAANIRNAITTFERTLITTNSRFDQYLLGDINAISSKAKKGYRLFKSYGCVACHQGSNIGGNMFMKFGVFGNYYADEIKKNHSYNLGRYNITKKEDDRFVFRVPSLRLVSLTAPYFHDGSVETLQQAIKIMAKHQLGRNISEQHIGDIIAFLNTLAGDYKGQSLYDKHQRARNK